MGGVIQGGLRRETEEAIASQVVEGYLYRVTCQVFYSSDTPDYGCIEWVAHRADPPGRAGDIIIDPWYRLSAAGQFTLPEAEKLMEFIRGSQELETQINMASLSIQPGSLRRHPVFMEGTARYLLGGGDPLPFPVIGFIQDDGVL